MIFVKSSRFFSILCETTYLLLANQQSSDTCLRLQTGCKKVERSLVEVPVGSVDLVAQTENIIYICEAISMLLIFQLLILVGWFGGSNQTEYKILLKINS